MTLRKLIPLLLIFSGLSLYGCSFIQRPFHKTIDDTAAPTAIPIPTDIPELTPSATPASTPQQTEKSEEETQLPEPESAVIPTRIVPTQEDIKLPPGFGISVFVSGLKDPRMMALGPDRNLYVAERGAGRIIRLPDLDQDGIADAVEPVIPDLRSPSSIAFHPDGSLYVGETTRVLKFNNPNLNGEFQDRETIVDGLPSGGHNTRTVMFSIKGDYIYVSVGSSCNVCNENDTRRATLVRYRPDGSEETIFAKGLRNAVGVTLRPGTDEIWVTNNGRDWLGDDQPPETVYRVELGDDAGWPRCHSGRIEDPEYGQPGACEGVLAPMVEMQAHSAPLGLTFYTGEQFPSSFLGNLFVAFHGSWNRSTPTGYKIVRVQVDDNKLDAGQSLVVEDFATGWLRQDGSQWGRPVDVLTGYDGSLFISDDGGGKIYRVFYTGN